MLNILIINNKKIINCEAEPNNARQLKQKSGGVRWYIEHFLTEN